MPFFRTLILIFAIWLAFVLARQLMRSRRQNRVADTSAPKHSLPVTVVPCAYCGLHIPKNEALAANGRYYCCTSHKDGHSSQ